MSIHTYIHIHGIHNQVYVWASEHFTHKHIHTRLTPAPSRSHSHQGSPVRRHPSNKKAPHRHGDRALDGRRSSADFDPSRLAPPPAQSHTFFPHTPLPFPLDPSSQGATQTSRLKSSGPERPACIASRRLPSPTALPACLLLPPTRAVRLDSPSHTNTRPNTAPPCSAVAATPSRRLRRRHPRPRPASSAMPSLS